MIVQAAVFAGFGLIKQESYGIMRGVRGDATAFSFLNRNLQREGR